MRRRSFLKLAGAAIGAAFLPIGALLRAPDRPTVREGSVESELKWTAWPISEHHPDDEIADIKKNFVAFSRKMGIPATQTEWLINLGGQGPTT